MLDLNHLHYENPETAELKHFGRLIAALHVPLRKISLAPGAGWEWHRKRGNHSGPASYFSFQFRPLESGALGDTTLFIVTGHSFSNDRLNSAVDIGFAIGVKHFEFRSGYRWEVIDGDKFKGLNLGFGVRL